MQRDDFICGGRERQAGAGLLDSEVRCVGEAVRDRGAWTLLGESVAVRQLRSQIQRIAPYFRTALIRGEAGSGKQAVARAIHALSPGGDGPFVVMDAAALKDSVATTAPARGGTVYLKRVGELSAGQQAALFRFVRSCEERRSTTGEATRILAASDRDLKTLAAIRQFRQDLYERLSAVELQIPPLRQRMDDIPMLAELLLRRLADETGQCAKVLGETALAQLRERQWPENIRELERVVRHAVALTENGSIEPRHLVMGGETATPVPPIRLERLDDVVIRHVLDVLTRCGGNKLRAAELLGISRSTLYRMLGSKPASILALIE